MPYARRIFGRLLAQYNPNAGRGGGGSGGQDGSSGNNGNGAPGTSKICKKKNFTRRGLVQKKEVLLMKTLVFDSS